MKWLASLCSILILAGAPAMAERAACEKSETACVLDAAWSAALVLPEDKKALLSSAFLEIANGSNEPALLKYWEDRLGHSASDIPTYADYGWQKAEPILRDGGTDRLIMIARNRAEPLNFGRADALLSAGKKLRTTDPKGARALNSALLDLARSASSFEKPSLAHAAAELAMARCDRDLFEKALLYTDAPGNLRYAIWRTRFNDSVLSLLDRIRAIESDEDTRDVRRVLEGYRAIQDYGYCTARNDPIGG